MASKANLAPTNVGASKTSEGAILSFDLPDLANHYTISLARQGERDPVWSKEYKQLTKGRRNDNLTLDAKSDDVDLEDGTYDLELTPLNGGEQFATEFGTLEIGAGYVAYTHENSMVVSAVPSPASAPKGAGQATGSGTAAPATEDAPAAAATIPAPAKEVKLAPTADPRALTTSIGAVLEVAASTSSAPAEDATPKIGATPVPDCRKLVAKGSKLILAFVRTNKMGRPKSDGISIGLGIDLATVASVTVSGMSKKTGNVVCSPRSVDLSDFTSDGSINLSMRRLADKNAELDRTGDTIIWTATATGKDDSIQSAIVETELTRDNVWDILSSSREEFGRLAREERASSQGVQEEIAYLRRRLDEASQAQLPARKGSEETEADIQSLRDELPNLVAIAVKKALPRPQPRTVAEIDAELLGATTARKPSGDKNPPVLTDPKPATTKVVVAETPAKAGKESAAEKPAVSVRDGEVKKNGGKYHRIILWALIFLIFFVLAIVLGVVLGSQALHMPWPAQQAAVPATVQPAAPIVVPVVIPSQPAPVQQNEHESEWTEVEDKGQTAEDQLPEKSEVTPTSSPTACSEPLPPDLCAGNGAQPDTVVVHRNVVSVVENGVIMLQPSYEIPTEYVLAGWINGFYYAYRDGRTYGWRALDHEGHLLHERRPDVDRFIAQNIEQSRHSNGQHVALGQPGRVNEGRNGFNNPFDRKSTRPPPIQPRMQDQRRHQTPQAQVQPQQAQTRARMPGTTAHIDTHGYTFDRPAPRTASEQPRPVPKSVPTRVRR